MEENLLDIVNNKLDCEIELSEFELQYLSYVHFRANTLQKGMNLLFPQLLFK